MSKRQSADRLPEEFSSYEEAAEFWDAHDTADYPDAFAREPTSIEASIHKRHYEVEVDQDLFGKLRQRARDSGVPVKRLVSDLLRRQLAARA